MAIEFKRNLRSCIALDTGHVVLVILGHVHIVHVQIVHVHIVHVR